MKIDIISSDGIQRAEKDALERIQRTFNESQFSTSWHGFAGFEMIDAVHRDREIDLVLLTHDRVLLLELKNWHGPITPMRDHWLLRGNDMGRSPVKVLAAKCKIFASKMKRRLPEPVCSSWNEYRVILCGSEEISAIPEDEKAFVLRLEEFLKIATSGNYTRILGPRKSGNPCAETSVFSTFIRGPEFKAGTFSFNNFQIDGEASFEHPDKLYKEYRSLKRDDPRVQALLRRWDFSVLSGKADTTDERAHIALREHRVLAYLQDHDEEISLRFLEPLTFPTRDDINVDFCELYKLPQRQMRLTAFVAKHRDLLSAADRLALVKVLLTIFADLHELGVAHRDVSDHAIWLERPTKVSVSGLIAAYFPEVGTVGGLQGLIRGGGILLPEDSKDLGDGTSTDPFRRDVYLLGIAAHHLLFLQPPAASLGIYNWNQVTDDPYSGRLDSWFSKALDLVPQDRFSNAREMLNALNSITALPDAKPEVDFRDFAVYETDILPSIAYPPERHIRQGRTHVYRSSIGDQPVCVKVWYGVAPDLKKMGEAHRLLDFLNRVRLLKAQKCDGIPAVMDFGISPAGAFLVTEWLEGEPLSQCTSQPRTLFECLKLCKELVSKLDQLHSLSIFHGDLSPANTLLRDGAVAFIDLVDFFPEVDTQPHNTLYAPINAESTTAQERDSFAVATICQQLLHNATMDTTVDISDLESEIASCLDFSFGTYRLDRIAGALDKLLAPPTPPREIFTVILRNAPSEPFSIANDNGEYHVGLFPDRKTPANIMLSIVGVRSQILIAIDKLSRRPAWVKFSEIPHSQFFRHANTAVTRLHAEIRITAGTRSDATQLCAKILEIESIRELFGEYSGFQEDRPDTEHEVEAAPATRELWQAILDAEEATLPQIEVAGTLKWDLDVNGRVHIPYSKSGEPIDYDPDDRINVLQDVSGDFIRIGELNTRETSPTILVVDRVERRLRCQLGEALRLQSVQDRASFQKRHAAALRIAERKSVIPELLDFFDPSLSPAPQSYDQTPSDEDLSQYDQRKDGELVFSLNEQQRSAFKKLWTNGPVSLLQGPPGTGKTAFIASFIHYAFKSGAQQILLASQSHEAVNNAAEKVLELCHRTTTDIGIVRFGSEGMVSEPLRPYHVNSILLEYRDLFRAEMRSRIAGLAPNIGVPKEFAEEWWDIDHNLGRIERDIRRLRHRLENTNELAKARIEAIESRIKKRLGLFDRLAEAKFHVSVTGSPEDTIRSLQSALMSKFGIHSPDLMSRLNQLNLLAQEWLDRLATLSGNFEEFLAKTRNLVCGTCVGLGRAEFGVVRNKYDWVIIDEAARATPGELSVAMQTGRRVLLVGDHRQLPPLYSKEVIDQLVNQFPGTSRESLTRSDFERAFESTYGKLVGASLQTQYRMAPAIGSLVSECFYPVPLLAGRGDPAPIHAQLPLGAASTVNWVDTSDSPSALERKTQDHSFENGYECRLILTMLRRISHLDAWLEQVSQISSGENQPIGVICTYAKQKFLLQRMLSEQEWAVKLRDHVKVDTVDSYQGKENRVIILSLTRNNPYFDQGFLRSQERINVSVSRAMDRLIIVGAARMWSEANTTSPLGKVLSFIRTKDNPSDYVIVPSENVLKGASK